MVPVVELTGQSFRLQLVLKQAQVVHFRAATTQAQVGELPMALALMQVEKREQSQQATWPRRCFDGGGGRTVSSSSETSLLLSLLLAECSRIRGVRRAISVGGLLRTVPWVFKKLLDGAFVVVVGRPWPSKMTIAVEASFASIPSNATDDATLLIHTDDGVFGRLEMA